MQTQNHLTLERCKALLPPSYPLRPVSQNENLLRNRRPIPVRIELHSNYDCINSHWFESQGGYCYQASYFGAMADALNLNPSRLKWHMNRRGISTVGSFPKMSERNGQEFVSYDDFIEELSNSSASANLLVFLGVISPVEVYRREFPIKRVILPQGNPCGIFSSCSGGESLLEMKLSRDMPITLCEKPYDYFFLEVDSADGYAITDVYGLNDDYFGHHIRIEEA